MPRSSSYDNLIKMEPKRIFAYVGTYHPNGQGVHLVECDAVTGKLYNKKIVSDLIDAAQLVLSASGNELYVASEISNYKNTHAGLIVAYKTNRQDGSLTEINRVSSAGAEPAYITIHPSGKYVMAANYKSGSVAIFPIREDGGIFDSCCIKQSIGIPNSPRPQAADHGSFAFSDHDGPHAHMIESAPEGKFVFSTDVGLDRIYQWHFNEINGQLIANNPAYIMASSKGAGPRHFVFHPKLDLVYLLNEQASIITRYHFNRQTGILKMLDSVSSLPSNYRGTSFASSILISQDGRHLYAGNRLHNSIAHFLINEQGDMALAEHVWTEGDSPRTMTFSPKGDFFYIMNQHSDNITQFKVGQESGTLTFINSYVDIGSPSQLVFLQNNEYVNK